MWFWFYSWRDGSRVIVVPCYGRVDRDWLDAIELGPHIFTLWLGRD